jgi:hypothetical protein
MRTAPARPRRLLAAVACLGIPALLALVPVQAALADTTSPTSLVSTTTTAVKSTTSGLGLSTYTSKATSTTSTSRTTSTSSSGSDCSGNVVCTDGVTLDTTNGLAVCSLYVMGQPAQPASNGCDNGTTTAKGNIALAVGRTNVNSSLVSGSSTDPLIEADTCGIALALDQGNGSTAKVVCGSAPGLGSSSVDLGNIMAVLGPSYASLSQGGDLSADICGAAAALGMDDTKTNVDVYCETLSSATNWQASVPATTASVGDDLLSADVQKTFVFANLSQGVAVTICDVNVGLFGSQLIDTGQVNVALPPNTGPTVNCKQDANMNPIVSNGPINLAVGDTGAGGGLNEGGGSGGTCGAGGGASQGGPASTTNSCGTTTPPPGYSTVPGPSNGAIANGDIAVVLGQNNANAGPNSGPGGNGDFGLGANACGGAGSGGGTGASVKCQQVSYVKTSVQGAHVTKPPAKQPAAAAGPANLAKTGFPLLSGLLGLILIAIGGIEMMRRRSEEASA